MNKIVATSDGSASVYSTQFGEQYHSKHGAWSESVYVFIEMGLLQKIHRPQLRIFEMGFGTGLNLLLTLKYVPLMCQLYYETIDKFPLSNSDCLNYAEFLTSQDRPLFEKLHLLDWNQEVVLNEQTIVKKVKTDIYDHRTSQIFDVVYFDAFSPRTQPECWSRAIFDKLYQSMEDDGILVTYCAKGSIKRLLAKVGFEIETLPGPLYKREMIRATKIQTD